MSHYSLKMSLRAEIRDLLAIRRQLTLTIPVIAGAREQAFLVHPISPLFPEAPASGAAALSRPPGRYCR